MSFPAVTVVLPGGLRAPGSVSASLGEASENRALEYRMTKAWASHWDPAASVKYSER